VGAAVCQTVARRPDARDRGTPQGSAASPVLANLFMHYAFDTWLARKFPAVRFERFADDGVVHCATEYQARQVLAALHERMAQVGLELHPDKTGVVYCKDGKRRGAYGRTEFTFLGFTFRPRGALGKNGKMFLSFLPATSKDALKTMSATVRAWRLHRRTGSTEPGRAGLDGLLRGFLPLSAHTPAGAHHRLLDALVPKQV
jgi:RNA-directed DNA polymerase